MTAPNPSTDSPNPSTDYSLRILWSLARWIEDTKGRSALKEVASSAGVKDSDFDGSTRWVSHEQFEAILASARELAGSDEAFSACCTHRFTESYGPIKYMVWALSPQQLCESAAKLCKLVTTVGRFEVVSSSRTSFSVRYYSDKQESRLMCLSRQAQWSVGPTMWGLPAAHLEETACVAHGDPCCEYQLRWFDRRRPWPLILGAIVGGSLAAALTLAHVGGLPNLTLVLLGAALGYAYELRMTQSANLRVGSEINDALRQLGSAEAEARAEIVALHHRQRDWIRLMEEQVAERTTTLERIVEELGGLQESRVSTIRGFSHDLRNPLFVLRGNTQFLLEQFPEGEAEGETREILTDMEAAAYQIEAMLARLMEVATHEPASIKLDPQPVAVAPLAETFRRRLRALVQSRDIKVSVFCTREAPDEIVIDPLVLDRVVDNLLTNAAKYTHRGSILLEISGTPAPTISENSRSGASLTLKLSDTGEGIPPSDVQRIFRPRPASEPSRPNSYGVGLSSVVRLLGQIGGRIDVMSKPGVGTTFWAHFPVAPPDTSVTGLRDDNLESIITRVVTIRKAEGA